MADFIQGDYAYTIISDASGAKVGAKVVDTLKSGYEDIPNTVINQGVTYTVISLGHCFDNCTSLITAPEIPNSVTNLDFCFNYCTSLTMVPEIPNGVTDMDYCFNRCTSLITAPEIPNSVTDMEGCFYGCTKLTTVSVISNSVTNMSDCFYHCIRLTTAPEIPASVTNMAGCFSDCIGLITAPVIPNGVTNLSKCFDNCTALTTAPTIPASVTNMNYCFNSCAKLTNAVVVFNNPTLYNGIFGYTSKQIRIAVVGQNQSSAINTWTTIASQYSNVAMWSASTHIDVYIGDYFYHVNESIVTTEDNVTMNVRVASYSRNKTKFDKIIAPLYINNIIYNVTSMNYCFGNCTSLTTAPVIPNSVTDMSYCFEYCISLTTVPEIPNSVTGMSYCFNNCASLTTPPKIPNSVTDMTGCFGYCTSLTMIPVIPDSVTDMSYCFSDCTSLTRAPAIPASVTNMVGCFNNCTLLTTPPKIPDSITNMSYCFSGCTNLTTFPKMTFKNIDTMGRCFENCINLTGNIKISWPADVDGDAFIGTEKPIYLINNTADIENWRTRYNEYRANQDNIYLAEEIGNYNCVELTTSTAKLIPNDNTQCSYYDFTNYNSVAFWGETHNVVALSFEDCNNLMISPYISNFITDMDNCFSGCTNLRGVIKVANNPTNYTDIFADTVYPIRIIDYNSTPSTTWQTIANTYDNVTYSQLQTAYVDVKRLGNSIIFSNLSETNDSQSTKTKVYVSGIDFTNIPDDWQSYIVEFAV